MTFQTLAENQGPAKGVTGSSKAFTGEGAAAVLSPSEPDLLVSQGTVPAWGVTAPNQNQNRGDCFHQAASPLCSAEDLDLVHVP